MNEKKGKKGCNYTRAEKEALVTIVKRYIGILEDKHTNAVNIKKKKDAWVEVAQKYNAVATSGLRTWAQLRHAYANIKQRAKKNIAYENKQQYYHKELKMKAAEDKKNLMKTGGGRHISVLSEMDNQVLAMVAPQITPLPNKYDDAASYFDEEVIVSNVDVDWENLETTNLPDEEVIVSNVDIHCENLEITNPPDEEGIARNVDIHCQNLEITNSPGEVTKSKPRKVESKSTKEKYFDLKLANAKLERKCLLKKLRCESLQLQLVKLKIDKFKNNNKLRK